MLRWCLMLALSLLGCSDVAFVAPPSGDEVKTELYLHRQVGSAWMHTLREPADAALTLEDIEEAYLLQYDVPRAEVEGWLESGGFERCQLLSARTFALGFDPTIAFLQTELPAEILDLVLPVRSELCVSCRPFRARSIIYERPPPGFDLVRTGGPNAVLPSGALIASGMPGHGFFRVTRDGAVRLGGETVDYLVGLERLRDGRYLAADSSRLIILEVDAAETTVTLGPTYSVDGRQEGNGIHTFVISGPDEPSDVIVADLFGRILRFDEGIWTVLAEVPGPITPPPSSASIVRLSATHIYLGLERPVIYELKDGRLRSHDFGRGRIITLAAVLGLGLIAGDEFGESLLLRDSVVTSLGSGGLLDDVRSLAPYRDGFVALMRGGFIGQYATHQGAFCPETSTIPGAQNASMRRLRAVPEGFFCSDCIQSRDGGPYGATWLLTD